MLSFLLALGPDFLKPEFWFDKAGAAAFWVVVAIIFAESGLFFGFFLPGDSLLFFTGFLTSPAALDSTTFGTFASHLPSIWVVLPVLFVAAVVGDQVGYVFGNKVGGALFKRPDSRLFKQEYLTKAHDFFEKHGPKSIFLARFVPIVRTFTPIVAGVSDMHYSTFVRWNILGGFVWAVGVTTLGHFLGQVGFIRDNIEYAIIVLVLISISPMIIEVIRHRRARSKGLDGNSAVQEPADLVSGEADG
jgi:membrane-associated protein